MPSTDIQAPIVRRRKRYQRPVSPTASGSFQLTDRDRLILQRVFEYRFLSSRQIAELIDGSPKKILERLTELFHAGYLDRPRAQHDYYVNGTAPLVYALGNRGAGEIRARNAADQAHLDWTQKNARATRRFIDHTLEIATFRIQLAKAVASHSSLALIEGHDLVAALDLDPTVRSTWSLRARLHHAGEQETIAVVPDHVAMLSNPDGRRRTFLIEIDRGTMPVALRADLRSTSVMRKLMTYDAAWRADAHLKQWGLKTFKVLIVTDGKGRVNTILAAIKSLNSHRGSDLFWVIDRESLQASDILGPVWIDHRGAHNVLFGTA